MVEPGEVSTRSDTVSLVEPGERQRARVETR
jgi:hypothetical protein